MLNELTIKQSVMGGLMFRGNISFPGCPEGGYHLGISYRGRNDDGAEVFELSKRALAPSESATIEATIDFDFYHLQYWVDEVRLIIEGEPDAIFTVEHLGRNA